MSVCVLFVFVLIVQVQQAQGQLILQATEDSFTRAGSKSDTNFGDRDFMQSASGEGSNLHEIYLKYDVSNDISDLDMIKSATLNLVPFGTKWGEDGSTTWVSYIQDDTWSEATITYTTRPSTTQDSVAAVVTTSSGGETQESVHTIDITDLLKGETDKVLSMRINNSLLAGTFKANYHTKEYTDGGAYLEIELHKPGTAFSASAQSIKAGGTVSFTDESTYSPTSWKWTFAGGTPAESTEQNPTVTYSTEGKYDVTLEATNAGGSNTVTQSGYIVVDAEGVTTVKIYPAEDSFTRSGSKSDANFGDRDYMQAASGEGSNLHEIYLKYDLSQEIADLELVQSATLNLVPFGTKWGDEGSTTWVSYIQDDTWSETTITYNTGRPTPTEDSVAAVVTTSSGGETLEPVHTIDVTDLVKRETDNTLSLLVKNSLLAGTYKANYHTKEHSTGGAYLEVVIEQSDVLAVKDAQINMDIYPNPTTDRIQIANMNAAITKVVVYNVSGKMERIHLIDAELPEITISLADLAKGTYLIRAYDKQGGVKTGRIIKQ
ncbi:putative secreted protein (Por secretion system target) [Marinoscillum furvescens DSM 4134]|uniref:Putative secreted protein (Por secretion system target) n=2 Tax=Marinoscillum furvescens TaxID=1026 RepID=A0A3D9L5U6_MARFU|nr:putative secreted protein (Por secretion system target) [Marinoscillum furvescens DSM 4134]